MNKTLALSLIAAGLLTAGGAQAASHNLETFVAEQDLDKNGAVSKDEYQKGRDAEFARQDADSNGVLSKTEYVGDFTRRLLAGNPPEERKARELRQADVRFGVLDSDKSDGISHAEYTASGWGMWTVHDRDRNGRVDADDLKVPAKDGAD